jgi:hypothetical protein
VKTEKEGSPSQCDRIGRIFAQLGDFFTLGSFLKNYRNSPPLWATFIHGFDNVFNVDKNVLGYTLGDFFTNSSGHPAPSPSQFIIDFFLLSTFSLPRKNTILFRIG